MRFVRQNGRSCAQGRRVTRGSRDPRTQRFPSATPLSCASRLARDSPGSDGSARSFRSLSLCHPYAAPRAFAGDTCAVARAHPRDRHPRLLADADAPAGDAACIDTPLRRPPASFAPMAPAGRISGTPCISSNSSKPSHDRAVAVARDRREGPATSRRKRIHVPADSTPPQI